MPFIYGVFSEEYNRLKEKKQDYEEKLKNLPKGALVKKQIKGRSYDYLVYRLNGKVVTEYVKKDRLEELFDQLERRKKIEESLKSINHDIKLTEKVVKNEHMNKKRLTNPQKERLALLNQELERIVDILINQYNPKKIILFGSLASGNVHEWSDIDLIVIKDTDKRFHERLKEVILLTSPAVDASIFVYTPEEFEENKKKLIVQEEVLKKGRVLYDTV